MEEGRWKREDGRWKMEEGRRKSGRPRKESPTLDKARVSSVLILLDDYFLTLHDMNLLALAINLVDATALQVVVWGVGIVDVA